MSQRTLVSWIGHTDIRAMAEGSSEKIRKKVFEVAGEAFGNEGDGPVKRLLDQETFGQINLISSYPKDISSAYRRWLGDVAKKIKLHEVNISNPSDHGSVLRSVQPILEQIKLKQEDELCFHLSPGTPAMAAIWILLAKSKYPATLYQSYKGGVSKAEIPFDITVDVLPKLLSEPDRFWKHLVDEGVEGEGGFDGIIGESSAIRLAMGRAKRAAIFDVTVLILGESGTGKELFASAIHRASSRRDKPFVSINCAAISKDLLESELFGHVKGAFTGASSNRDGAFQQADGGTLFLDEVGECDLAMQAKILRALQPPPGGNASDRVFRRVGDSKDSRADVRIVAATNRDLPSEIRHGSFREDLFYRLSMITVKLPPLRERKTDIQKVAKGLLSQVNDQFSSNDRPAYVEKTLSREALQYISGYHWPGNIRQLYNALIQAAIMQDRPKLQPRDIASALGSIPSPERQSAAEVVLSDDFNIDDYLDDLRRALIVKAMDQASGVKTRAAALLGMKHYQTLDAQIKRLKINI